jgi:hypothetical protein
VKPLLMLTVALLAVILVLKGIFPALTTVRTDFANYYTSSYVLVHENKNIDKLYDADWFARKAAALGSPDGGIFQPFPPPTALLMVPLTIFDMQTAERIWTVLNVGILIVFVSTVSRLSAFDPVLSFFLVLVSGFALINNFYLGQIYLLMVLCLALSIRYYLRGKDLLSGLYAGIFIPVKYFPICLLIFFILQRRWFAAAAGVLVALILVCISLASMGWEIHWSYAQRILVHHLDGQMANPFSARYQSWNSLLRSVFIGDGALNPHPLVDWPEAFAPLRAFVLVGLSAILSWVLWKGVHANVGASLQIAALFTFALLVAPATATYHLLLLSLPVTMVASQLLSANRLLPLSILLILYAGMGAIPAGMLDRLDLQGAWRLLEFPRLFFLLAFFLTITLLTVSGGRREQCPQTL